LELLLPYIDEYVVDIKDMNTQIYESYTGKSNSQVKENLKWLVEQGMAERILCRIPLIPNYNNASDQEKSKKELSEMGITRFEMFTYLIDKERESISNKLCRLKKEFRKIATKGIIDEE
jgi:pyruvate formate lyase activating enzyme